MQRRNAMIGKPKYVDREVVKFVIEDEIKVGTVEMGDLVCGKLQAAK